jgi:molybdopterin biosynthesis enzyme
MVKADGLIVLARDVEGAERGRQVDVRLLQGDARG